MKWYHNIWNFHYIPSILAKEKPASWYLVENIIHSLTSRSKPNLQESLLVTSSFFNHVHLVNGDAKLIHLCCLLRSTTTQCFHSKTGTQYPHDPQHHPPSSPSQAFTKTDSILPTTGEDLSHESLFFFKASSQVLEIIFFFKASSQVLESIFFFKASSQVLESLTLFKASSQVLTRSEPISPTDIEPKKGTRKISIPELHLAKP